MKKFLLFYSLVLSANAFAQNLVPNYSFEDTVACPVAQNEVNRAIGWSSYRASPDYFNMCNILSVGIPANFAGYQTPRDGSAYAGLISFYSPLPNLREYIGIQLTQPLTIGVKYFLSFYTTRAYNTSLIGIAINKIGARLTTTSYSSSNPLPIDNYANISSNNIITDTSLWTRVSGSFIADSGYQYLSIGNFFDDTSTSILQPDSNKIYAYYYIDDVCVSTDSLTCNGFTETQSEIINHNSQIKLFPNPTHSSFTLQCPASIVNTELTIFNLVGQEVFQTIITNQSTIINPNLAAGVYYVKVASTASATGQVQKLVVY
jgi:hypothetical protein